MVPGGVMAPSLARRNLPVERALSAKAGDRLAPQSLAAELVQTAADWRARLSGALEQGQAAMAEREAELRAQLAEPGSGAG